MCYLVLQTRVGSPLWSEAGLGAGSGMVLGPFLSYSLLSSGGDPLMTRGTTKAENSECGTLRK